MWSFSVMQCMCMTASVNSLALAVYALCNLRVSLSRPLLHSLLMEQLSNRQNGGGCGVCIKSADACEKFSLFLLLRSYH